jgi:hypothetical protein
MNLPPIAPKALLCLALTLPLLACGRPSNSAVPGGTGGTTGAPDASTGGAGSGGTTTGLDAAAGAPDGGIANGGAGGAPMADAATPLDGLPAVANCQLPAGLPLKGRFLPNVPRSMDFTFDKDGNFVAVEMTTGALKATPYQGAPVTLFAGATSGFGRGAHSLPNGDVLFVDAGKTLTSITPQGEKNTLGMLNGAHGVTLDAQGRPVISALDGIFRLEGTQLTAVSNDPHRAAAVAFSPDYGTLYAATPAGEIRKMDMGRDGKAGPQQLLATVPKDSSTLIVDDMTVDECGNLFVVNASGQVWRVTAAGQTTKVIEVSATLGGPSFGSARGGWKETALYVAVPSGADPAMGGALEVDLGFRGMKDPGLSAAR